MASNDTVELTSDKTSAMACSVCKEQNKNTIAAKYCVDCQAFYCTECLKSHKIVPGLKSHKLLDKDDDKMEQLEMIPTETCERHHFKTVDMFCESHDEVGCATCIAVDHRNCKDVFYIPEMMNTRNNNECQQRLDNIEKKFNIFLKKFNDEDDALQANKQCEIDRINAYVKQSEDKIKQAAQDAISEVEIRFNKLKTSLTGHTTVTKCQFEKFSTIKDEIETTKQNKSQVFVASKLNKAIISPTEEACEEISHIELGRRVQFTLDPKFEHLIEENVVLGSTHIQTYTFVHKGSFDIKIPSDKTNCNVEGSCILPNGSIVLSDSYNNNIRLVDGTTLKVIDYHIFQSLPRDVCCVQGNENAVTLSSQTISLFNVNNKLYKKVDISLNINCHGLFYHDNIFYLTNYGKYIYLVDLSGKLLKTITNETLENENDSKLYYIYVNAISKVIYASDWQQQGKGVLCFNQDGKIVNTVSKDIVWPHALADAGHGKVFACGYSSNNVIIVNEKCEFEKVVIKDGLSGPQALCFNAKTGRLYVSNCGSDTVQLYEAE